MIKLSDKTELNTYEALQGALDEIFGSDKIIKGTISSPKNKSSEYKKYKISYKTGDKIRPYYQIERFTDKQVFHENKEPESVAEYLADVILGGFKRFDAQSADKSYSLMVSKKGKVSLVKKNIKPGAAGKTDTGHDRKKNYILKEGADIPPLVDLGVFSPDGKIVKARYDKFKQINRFTELIADAVKELPENSRLDIIDFGCGKSYLTFILYHYLTNVKGFDAHITGLDLKEDVIRKCAALAEKYGYENLSFRVGDINGFKCETPPDMVISLHACDTATDYAIYNAVEWDAKIILAVPCCQHELNSQMKPKSLDILSKYGLIKERFSALATDAIRGTILEYCGYSVTEPEFIDIAHSPKNLLIRAVKTNASDISPSRKRKLLKQLNSIIDEFGFSPTLYRLLIEGVDS